MEIRQIDYVVNKCKRHSTADNQSRSPPCAVLPDGEGEN